MAWKRLVYQGLPGVANNGPVVKAQLEKIANNNVKQFSLQMPAGWVEKAVIHVMAIAQSSFRCEIIDGSLSQTDLSPENNQIEFGDQFHLFRSQIML